ncbi:MAG: hypothetical protein HPY44_02630 [Armatimonadetes bacterium]|nr:hypothetical protein [Armatimonadota bacterium]
MATMELRQELRVTTQVNVLPQLVARAALLEMSQEGLEDRIREELETNPALELAAPNLWGPVFQPVADAEEQDALARCANPVSLRDDLLLQARATCHGALLRHVEYLIESLDERGYLPAHAVSLAEEMEIPVARVEEAIAHLRSLEPAGIGARDLVDCLLLQLERLAPGQAPEGLREFIDNRLRQALGSGDPRLLKTLQDRRGAPFLTFIAEHFHPYPADLYQPPHRLEAQLVPTKLPDAVVEMDNGCLRVCVPLARAMALRISQTYEGLARATSAVRGQDAGMQAIRRLVNEARQFIDNLTHRHATIALVTRALLEEQSDFLEYGPSGLRPLTKKQLAQRLRMHESTICRATRGKTVMLPDGEVLPFDVFFEDALPAKVTLAKIIHSEDPNAPMTDNELVQAMQARGFGLARRTVSKYRESLGIPTASTRRGGNWSRSTPAAERR